MCKLFQIFSSRLLVYWFCYHDMYNSPLSCLQGWLKLCQRGHNEPLYTNIIINLYMCFLCDLQVVIPFILVTCALRAVHVISCVPVDGLFLLVMLMSDAMAFVRCVRKLNLFCNTLKL